MQQIDRDAAERIAGQCLVLGGTVHGTVYRRAFQAAADAILLLTTPPKVVPAADGYAIDLEDRTKKMRITLLQGGKSLAYREVSSEDAYDMAARILDGYDALEGID